MGKRGKREGKRWKGKEGREGKKPNPKKTVSEMLKNTSGEALKLTFLQHQNAQLNY